jgi:dihydroorotase-like cyclic amidohydrolase
MPVFPDDGVIFTAFRACAATGALAMVHAENAQVIEAVGADLAGERTGLEAWEARFPGDLEASEIRKAADFARATGARCYVAHVTSAAGMTAIDRARADGADIWAETCPQYLALDFEKDGQRGAWVKFNPPIRQRADREALWSALASHRIAAVGSDHVPNPRPVKLGDGTVAGAASASPGVGTLLPVLWTFGVEAGRIPPGRLVQVAAEDPARLFGLYPRKGVIRPGADADLVVCDPRTRRTVDPATLHSAADYSAYAGMSLVGWPVVTLLRGQIVAEQGRPVGEPRGRYLHRPLG